mmetsp:Transcript_3226/g.9837  ORF Transcript_3226/g.9837 Transcript_3226/m.9837 type:complete len:241 (-) Transcript_3226:1801-2523(-)
MHTNRINDSPLLHGLDQITSHRSAATCQLRLRFSSRLARFVTSGNLGTLPKYFRPPRSQKIENLRLHIIAAVKFHSVCECNVQIVHTSEHLGAHRSLQGRQDLPEPSVRWNGLQPGPCRLAQQSAPTLHLGASLTLAEELPDLRSRRSRFCKLEPRGGRAWRRRSSDYLYHVSVLQLVVEANNSSVDLGPDHPVAYFGMYSVSDVNGARVPGQVHNSTFGCEDKDAISQQVKTDCIDKVT